MADGMKLKVVTPTGGFYDGEVSMVELTTTEGEIGVYPNHIPLTAVERRREGSSTAVRIHHHSAGAGYCYGRGG